MRRFLVTLCALVVATTVRGGEPAHVYLVVVDGLDARFATPEHMPRLYGLATREPEKTSVLPALAVMPTRTNPNHASLLTGLHAEAHGIVGNAYAPRGAAHAEKMDDPALFRVETLLTVVERRTPARRTVAAFGKPKLARLFGPGGRQRAPDVLWSPEALPATRRDPAAGYAGDADTMAALLAAIADAEPDFAVVNLAGVDLAAHANGPESPKVTAAVGEADAAIGRLVDALVGHDAWRRSVVVVTADHGFDDVARRPGRDEPVIVMSRVLAKDAADVAGVLVVGDGGVAHVYDARATAGALGEAAPRLAKVAMVARATPGVAEVLARLPVPGVRLLAEAHPDWHLAADERIGDLLLVAARGHVFVEDGGVEGALPGNHGGPGERAIPLVVSGGHPRLRRASAGGPPAGAVDIGATIAAMLDVPLPAPPAGVPATGDAVGHALAVWAPESRAATGRTD